MYTGMQFWEANTVIWSLDSHLFHFRNTAGCVLLVCSVFFWWLAQRNAEAPTSSASLTAAGCFWCECVQHSCWCQILFFFSTIGKNMLEGAAGVEKITFSKGPAVSHQHSGPNARCCSWLNHTPFLVVCVASTRANAADTCKSFANRTHHQSYYWFMHYSAMHVCVCSCQYYNF